MDSFTQVLLGIATAEIVAGNQLKNKTFLYGALLGTIPDLDVVIGFFMNPVSGIAIHRGLSHSLVFFLFLSPFLGGLIAHIEKPKITINRAILLVFFCLFTHVLLDLFTSWGTQILWPLPNRFALKTIFVIDPLYSIPLLVSLLYVFRTSTKLLRKKYLYRGVIISTSYLLLTCGLKLFALNKFEKALNQQKIETNEIIVKPTAFNCILWNANIATSNGYYLGDYSLLDTKPIQFVFYKRDTKIEKQISHSTDYQKLVAISEGWYLVSEQNQHIYFNDLRFGLLNDYPHDPQFAFSYEFIKNTDGSLHAIEVPKSKRDGKRLILNLGKRLKGN